MSRSLFTSGILLLAACAARGPGVGAPPAALPMAERPDTPPFDGAVDDLDLSGMNELRVRTTMTVDLSSLTRLDAGTATRFEAHLAADPRWRVTRWDGATVAVQRERLPWGWSVGVGGYNAVAGQGAWCTGVQFSPWLPDTPWASAPQVVHRQAAEASYFVVPRRLEGNAWSGQWSAALEIDGPAVGLFLHEISGDDPVPGVHSRLADLATLVESYLRLLGEANPRGVEPLLLAPGRGTAREAMRVATLPDGQVDLFAMLNPGAAGWTWLRLVDWAGRPLDQERVGALSWERVGWSEDPDQGFWFQARLPVTLEPDSKAEAWFLADGSSRPRLLGRWQVGPVTMP